MEWYNIGFLNDLRTMLLRHIVFWHLPLYDCVLSGVHALVSDLLFLRTVSLVASCLTLLLVFQLGSLIFSRGTALLGMVILALHPLFVFYAMQIELYAFFTCLVVLDVYIFYRVFIRGEFCLRPFLYLVSILLMTCHHLSFFILLAQVFYIVNDIRRTNSARRKGEWLVRRRQFLYFFLIATVVYVAVTLLFIRPPDYYFPRYEGGATYYLARQYGGSVIAAFVRVFFGIPSYWWWLTFLAASWLVISCYAIARRNEDFLRLCYALFLSFFIFESIYCIFFFTKDSVYFNVRQAHFLLPFISLISAAFLCHLFLQKRHALIVCAVFIIPLITANLSFSRDIIGKKQSPDYSGAVAYLKSRIKSGDTVAFSVGWFSQPFYYYLTSGSQNKTDCLDGEITFRDRERVLQIRNINQLQETDIDKGFAGGELRGKRKLWFIDVREEIFGIPHGNVMYSDRMIDLLGQKMRFLSKASFSKIAVYEFVPS